MQDFADQSYRGLASNQGEGKLMQYAQTKTSRGILKLVLAFTAFFTTSALLATPITPKSGEVDILASAARGADVIGKLAEGEVIEASERRGMFWQVSFQGKEGFISVMAVQRQASQSSSLQRAISEAAAESRDSDDVTNARSRSAVMGVRGLSDSGSVAEAGNVQPDVRRVFAMEDRQVNPEDVERLGELVFREVEHRVRRNER